MVDKEICQNCSAIAESLKRGKEEYHGDLSVLKWIFQYRSQYEFIEPCINKICLPLLMVANGDWKSSGEEKS